MRVRDKQIREDCRFDRHVSICHSVGHDEPAKDPDAERNPIDRVNTYHSLPPERQCGRGRHRGRHPHDESADHKKDVDTTDSESIWTKV